MPQLYPQNSQLKWNAWAGHPLTSRELLVLKGAQRPPVRFDWTWAFLLGQLLLDWCFWLQSSSLLCTCRSYPPRKPIAEGDFCSNAAWMFLFIIFLIWVCCRFRTTEKKKHLSEVWTVLIVLTSHPREPWKAPGIWHDTHEEGKYHLIHF